MLKDVIEMLGRLYAPLRVNGIVTLEIDASDRIASLISLLGSMPSEEAQKALTELIDDPLLTSWQDELTWARDRQRVALRDATYRHPSIERVQHTLSNGPPANAADLAALVKERLEEIGRSLRGDNSNPWRQFWNVDRYGRPTGTRPEESCRDAILALLKLPDGITAEPERHYAGGKRADITVSYGGINIPIELKKDSHPELWRGLRRQLIDQYTQDSAADGHGIYVPLWFGLQGHPIPPPPPSVGHRPKTAAELQQQLEQDLTAEEARKVSVLVLDVTKPGD